jgi:hypothetical protein
MPLRKRRSDSAALEKRAVIDDDKQRTGAGV